MSGPFRLGIDTGGTHMGCIALTNATIIDCTGADPVEGGSVVIEEDRIKEVLSGAPGSLPDETQVLDCRGMTLLPGLIDAHSHLLLHPYDEATWNDQVLKESLGLRTARAVAAAG